MKLMLRLIHWTIQTYVRQRISLIYQSFEHNFYNLQKKKKHQKWNIFHTWLHWWRRCDALIPILANCWTCITYITFEYVLKNLNDTDNIEWHRFLSCKYIHWTLRQQLITNVSNQVWKHRFVLTQNRTETKQCSLR